MNSQPKSPLSGIRVLDFTHVLSGPWATQTLGDFGAEIIKIERDQVGDMSRNWGKSIVDSPNKSYFYCCNRNKKSVVTDLNHPNDQEILGLMMPKVDVIVENFSVGTMAKFGLDYETLKKKYPELIYCSISGYGQTGPMAKLPAVDQLIQAASGMMDLNGTQGPTKIGIPVVDVTTGMYAVSAILAALIHRGKTGQGQYIDIALNDVALAMMANHSTMAVSAHTQPKAQGHKHGELAPYGAYKTQDGMVYVAVSNDKEFALFAQAVSRVTGDRRLLDELRFKTNAGRIQNYDQLNDIIEAKIRMAVTDVWVTFFQMHEVHCSPVNKVMDAFETAQAKYREMVIFRDGVRSVANPIKFSETPVQYTLPPPEMGNANAEIHNTLWIKRDEPSTYPDALR